MSGEKEQSCKHRKSSRATTQDASSRARSSAPSRPWSAASTCGGWTLGSTAQKQVSAAEQASVIRVLAPICADKFKNATDAGANLEALNKANSWKRDDMIVKAGWATFPGSEPDRQVADACAKLLAQVK